jgi:hypothetical protein
LDIDLEKVAMSEQNKLEVINKRSVNLAATSYLRTVYVDFPD